jgi:hypothetical protein
VRDGKTGETPMNFKKVEDRDPGMDWNKERDESNER